MGEFHFRAHRGTEIRISSWSKTILTIGLLFQMSALMTKFRIMIPWFSASESSQMPVTQRSRISRIVTRREFKLTNNKLMLKDYSHRSRTIISIGLCNPSCLIQQVNRRTKPTRWVGRQGQWIRHRLLISMLHQRERRNFRDKRQVMLGNHFMKEVDHTSKKIHLQGRCSPSVRILLHKIRISSLLQRELTRFHWAFKVQYLQISLTIINENLSKLMTMSQDSGQEEEARTNCTDRIESKRWDFPKFYLMSPAWFSGRSKARLQ